MITAHYSRGIRYTAVELAHQDSLPRQEFRSSKLRVCRFIKRKEFAFRQRTSVCQKLPDSYEDKLISFQRYDTHLREERKLPLGQKPNAG